MGLHMDLWTAMWRSTPALGMNRGRSVDDSPEPEVCESSSPRSLAGRSSNGVELSLRSPQGRRDGSGRRVHTTPNQLAGEESQTPGDAVAGTGQKAPSIGSITRTGQPKGPCCSYQRGPFTYFRDHPGSLASPANE